ncbi:GNAT family N-acetyltransferase [Gemmatimonas sp.]|uniref:GNAT family N-acetyltransferase n=1 Tax=Gemmatimonas sp. TaxID=1962908 RepID=UPI00286D853F|nr:GNAT family N-acetyltransferase [Gemmatimonas sp.]
MASADDVEMLARLARLASAAHDAFVFDDAEVQERFYSGLIDAQVAEFQPRFSTVACDTAGKLIGLLAVLTAAELKTVRLKGAMWIARSKLAASEPQLVRRLQLAASVGVRLQSTDSYLSRIAVLAHCGIPKVGQILLAAAISQARSSGAVRLVLDVSTDNCRARKFYDRADFHEIGRARVEDAASGRTLEFLHLALRVSDISALPSQSVPNVS